MFSSNSEKSGGSGRALAQSDSRLETYKALATDDELAPATRGNARRKSRNVPMHDLVTRTASLPSIEAEEYLDVVQWSSPIFYTEPSEGLVSIDVMRIGSMAGTCCISYATHLSESSECQHTAGDLEFGDGEDMKTVTIPLEDVKYWSTTSEFKIKLHSEKGCKIGTYLHTCRVKVIRVAPFPSEKFRTAEEIEAASSWSLYWGVIMCLFRMPGVGWVTVANIIVAQVYNLYTFALLCSAKYMVDVVLSKDKEKEEELLLHTGPHHGKIQTLVFLACVYTVPLPFLHLLKLTQRRLDLRNRLLGLLRAHLLNQFLNYTAESRMEVGDSRFQSAMNEEVTNLVNSYEKLIEIFKLAGKMVVLAAFVIREDPGALTTSSVMPLVLAVYAISRSAVVMHAYHVLAQKNIIALRVVQETLIKYDLVSQYQQRPRMLDIFRFADNEAGDAALDLEMVRLNNTTFASSLGPLFNGWTIAMRGPEVINGQLSLGTFLATISVYREFSELYGEIYNCFMIILGTLATTKDVTKCFNMPLELLGRKSQNRMRRRRLNEARALLLQHDLEHGQDLIARTDRVKLEITNLSLSYDKKVILRNVNMVIPQGGIVGISGPHGSGKATLMQLLAGILLPQFGSVFIPSHLRALYVPEETLLLALSAWANLTFGFPHAHPARVKDILLGLGMNETLELVKEDLRAIGRLEEMDIILTHDTFVPGYVTNSDELAGCRYGIEASDTWHHSLCNSEKSNFALARALITNPEVCILQRPLSSLEPENSQSLINVLQENIMNRGYKLPKESIRYRRPRTLFISSSSYMELNFVNSIWLLDLASGGVYRSDLKLVGKRYCGPKTNQREMSAPF